MAGYYFFPKNEMEFVLNQLADIEGVSQLDGYEEASSDLVSAVLEEAGKFASEVMAPLNQIGDQQGSKLVDGKVKVPDGFEAAYKQFVSAGWMGISQNPDFGGQGMPTLLYAAVSELWNASNTSFALNPLLTVGAIEAIDEHASDTLRKVFLPKLVSGEWTGTMNLTEPQAGSDLSAIRTKATPSGDHYLVEGQKIFITWGDHEMTENVIHLVLARLPDAPEGVKGISLFLVPKFLVNDDGSIGERNDVITASLEHKLGIHASPTCAMSFGENTGAVGYLVGQENKGLAHMFTMMNNARLAMAVQGVALCDRAYQQSALYAQERLQGGVTIIHHPDVRRMLMQMRTLTEATRSIAYLTASAADFAHRSSDREAAALSQERLDLLVPIAKGWCTEIAQEVTSLGIQVHGGMGYVEETGVAQYYRDARISTIYEGTTGIQAMDLVGRKMLRDKGAGMRRLLEEMEGFLAQLSNEQSEMIDFHRPLTEAVESLNASSQWLLGDGLEDVHGAGSAAMNMLMLSGTVFGGYQMIRAAVAANELLQNNEGDADFNKAKIVSAQFYADQILPRSKGYMASILAGSGSTMGLPVDQF